jgi:hypothetical protein
MKKTDKTIKIDAVEETTPKLTVPKVGVPKIGKPVGGAGSVLGSLSSGDETGPVQAEIPSASPAAPDAPLLLPKNALVIMRASGGLKFTSNEVVVFEDGSVTTRNALDDKAQPAAAKALTNAQLNKIRDLLTPDTFANAPKTAPAQKPDRYAYELAARIGRATKRAEVADGSMPDEIKKLVAELKKLLPK